ncbi:MAG: hypothetical protein PVJ02_16850 [Gemmatimonadota bacterium]
MSVLNAVLYLDRGWFPHDLGSVAQPAMRVLAGELPHRDFVDVYTGGLAFLNALVFRLVGPTAMAVRWAVLAVFTLWVPALWYVARRVTKPLMAAVVTLLGAAWTLPMYAEAMPSWYNLFLATFAAAALLRYLEVRTVRWLVLAGMATGVSILFKVVGLYAVAAGVLALTYMEVAEAPPRRDWSGGVCDAGYRWLVVAGSLGVVVAVVSLVSRAMGGGGLFRFAAAAVVPCLVLAARAGLVASDFPTTRRLRSLAAVVGPFLAGAVGVVALYLIPWLLSGSLGALYQGVFVLPRRRLVDAIWPGLRGGWLGVTLAAAAVVAVAMAPLAARRLRIWMAAGGALLLAAVLVLSRHSGVYVTAWQALWWLPPWVALAGGWALLRGTLPDGVQDGSPVQRVRLLLVLAFFGMVSLVEVPFAAPVYFFFAAPLLLPLAAGVAELGPASQVPTRRYGVLGLLVFLVGFTALRLDPGFIRYLGFRPDHDRQTEALRLPRAAGLHVTTEDRELYETVVPMVEALARGPYIYATPDSPELYFLTGRRNPTRTLFEFLDPHPDGRTERVLSTLDRTGVNVVVINRDPLFSDPVSADLVAGLQSRYPMAREVGRFLVVWREGASSTP